MRAVLPVIAAIAAACRMERRGLDHRYTDPFSAWCRQWLVWRAGFVSRRIFCT
jgi:hypothetical protein